MNLGIFLSPCESINSMKKTGQDARFVELYLKNYAKSFDKIYIFSYEDENPKLPKNILIVPNKTSLPRLLYALLLPIINKESIEKCDVIRGFGLASSISALFVKTPFVLNWAYDYISAVRIDKKFWYIPLYHLLEKIAFLKAKKVFIATNEKFKKIKGKKFIYLPNGVDINLFKRKKGMGSGAVFVGRFEKQKNLFFLIEAVSKLPKKLRAITFVGHGSQKEQLKRYAIEKGIELKIMSPVSNLELPKLLQNFSILTLSSHFEGSPKILLEAMALGLVPIATNFSTAKEIIKNGHNGYIIPYNINTYSKQLEFLLTNKTQISRISQNAQKSIVQDFDLGNLIAKEINILKEAAKS